MTERRETHPNPLPLAVKACLALLALSILFAGCEARPEAGEKPELSDITLSAGILEPAFSPAVTEYAITVPNGETSFVATGKPARPDVRSAGQSGKTIKLSVGKNAVVIEARGKRGTRKRYSLTVDRAGDYSSRAVPSLTLAFVPAGRFTRDSDPGNVSVIRSGFRISRHEITRSQYLAVMGIDPSNTMYSSGLDDPVQTVNWYQAIAFANRLSAADGLEPAYRVSGVDFAKLAFRDIPTGADARWDSAKVDWKASGYRLPTELEWTWAAMGATGSPDKPFAGSANGNDIASYAVYGNYGDDPGRTRAHRSNPVGSKLPNELGLYDMSGNIWEWCWDWYGEYPTGEVVSDDPDGRGRGPTTGKARVCRGGSWSREASYCAVSNRRSLEPHIAYIYFGFRVARP